MSIFTASDRIASLQRRLELWERNVDRRQHERSAVLNDFLIEADSSLEETFYGNIIQYLNGLQQAFQNSSDLLPTRLPGSKTHIACQRNRMACLCKITSVWWVLHLIQARNRNSVSFLWFNSAADIFKIIRNCPNVHFSDFSLFPQRISSKLDF